MGNAKIRYRDAGIEAVEVSGSRMMRVPLRALLMAPEGHWAHDPRSLDPADRAIVDDMKERVKAREPNLNRKALYVWAPLVNAKGEEAANADRVLVGDGHGRTIAGLVAERELRAERVIPRDAVLMVLIEIHQGDDRAAFLAERISRNHHADMARADSASVLAYRVRQLSAYGMRPEDLATRMHVRPAVIEALDAWETLTAASLRKRIDAGEVPLDLLPELQRKAKGEQDAEADRLLAAGVRTQKGATQRRNRARTDADPWARRMGPRVLRGVGKALQEVRGDYAEGAAAGLLLATLMGEDAQKHLDSMPKNIADRIRSAVSQKGGRS